MSSTLNALRPGMTAYEWHARLAERAAESVAHWVEKTQDDKVRWCPPLDEAKGVRTVLEQISECIHVNNRFAAQLRGEQAGAGDMKVYENRSEAADALRESGRNLAEAIRNLDDEAITKTIETPRGPMPVSIMMELPVSNMMYHGGVINYIQMLYGDEEFHIPEFFFA